MSTIWVTQDEYNSEVVLVNSLYKRQYQSNRRLDYWKSRMETWMDIVRGVRSQAITEKWTPDEFTYIDEKYLIPEIKKIQDKLNLWQTRWGENYNKLREEFWKVKRKKIRVVPPEPKYEFARVMKDQRIYARVKKTKQTPEPVCEVSVSAFIQLPRQMTTREIIDYVQSGEFTKEYPELTERVMEEDINEILYSASFGAGRKHKVWKESVYKIQQYESRGVDKEEVIEPLKTKRFWMMYYRPRTEYDDRTVRGWIRTIREYYVKSPLMLRHIRITKLEEYM